MARFGLNIDYKSIKMKNNRRRFLSNLGSATIMIPSLIKGYTSSELQHFSPERLNETNISIWDLDTPSLCVDLDILEANLSKLQAITTQNGIAARPHAKTHKCPQIARLQMAAGSIGICVAKISEAEVMFDHGIDKILCTTTNVTQDKIKRAMSLKKWCPDFIQATDSPANARLLSEAASAMGITADIVVDVDPGMHRTGIPAGEPALQLAQLVDQLPSLRLRGILCYDGGSQHVSGFEARKKQTLDRLAAAADTVGMMRKAGLNTEIFSGGGTGTYNIDHENEGFTDVQAGSYVFMDNQYMAIGGEHNTDVYDDFRPSLTILTTVLNDQYEGRVTTDAGAKACTINQPWPAVKGQSGMDYRSGSDEFGTLIFNDPSRTYRVGEKLELIVSHCDPVVNLYDQMYAIRNEKVEAIWKIYGRGKSS
ncbi:MAG: DSD1 family PLP-dependent enzyme [Saprospiraceae bacterium]|nr:DSD1 family PLP-dependent enzyme [Saprospiraceae bacterium]